MTKKIDEVQFIKDFHEGKNYIEIADKNKITIGTVAHRVRKLGLKRLAWNPNDTELIL